MKEPTYRKFTLLTIDAWNSPDGWTWNNWFPLEEGIFIDEKCLTPRRIIKRLRDWSYLSDYSKGRVYIEDDGYNLVVHLKSNHKPLLALCYGEHWEFNKL